MVFRIGWGGKRFFAVCENLDHESEIRIYDSKISKIGKKFRNSTKFTKCFPKCAKCHFRVCAKCNSKMSIFADFAKMPKCQKIGIGSPKHQKVTKTRFFDKKTTKKHVKNTTLQGRKRAYSTFGVAGITEKYIV